MNTSFSDAVARTLGATILTDAGGTDPCAGARNLSAAPARRRLLAGLVAAPALMAAGPVAAQLLAQAKASMVEVWKSPTCGCCGDWIAHMQANGFQVRVHDVGNAEARIRLGMPEKFASCHTATVGGYVLEGHVPASDVRRLLADRPGAVGLAVPGMPIGSPGMDGPEYKGRKDPYDVLLVERSGGARVFRAYNR